MTAGPEQADLLICCSRKNYSILYLKCMCLALIFQGIYIYMYIYIHTVYIGSTTQSLTIAPEGVQKEIPYSTYIMICIYIYMYNCHPAGATICILQGEPTGSIIHLKRCWDCTVTTWLLFMRQLYSNLPHLDSQKGVSRSTETTGRNGLERWEIFPMEIWGEV